MLNVRAVARFAPQVRNIRLDAAPPVNRLSSLELCAHGAVLFVGWLAVPVWVMSNLESYKGNK